MRSECGHQWKIVAIDYQPATTESRTLAVPELDRELFERLVFGVTFVQQRCSLCGDLRQKQLLGKLGGPGKTGYEQTIEESEA